MNDIVKTKVELGAPPVVLEKRTQITPSTWQLITLIANSASNSNLFNSFKSPEQAAMAMLKGLELGFGLVSSLDFIQHIDGKLDLNPRGALALLHSSPHIESVEIVRLEKDGAFYGYECTIRRTNGFEFTGRFTMDDAKRAGLTRAGSSWEKYPANMCLWRAVGFAADVAAPDVTAGMTTLLKAPEAFGVEFDDDGNVIEVREISPNLPSETSSADPLDLEQISKMYGAEKVLAANGGRIPATDREVEEVYRKLREGET